MDMVDYARYWHGYTVWLRPLLALTSHYDIRLLMQGVLGVLMLSTVVRIVKKVNSRTALLFGASMIPFYPYVIASSMQLFSVFGILLAAVNVLLCLYRRPNAKWETVLLFFAATGSITCFFDFLTAPLLTLGIPLLFLVLLETDFHTPIKGNAPSLLRLLALPCLCWGAGYAVTWGLKWIIGSLVLDRNILAEGLSSVAQRTAGAVLEGGDPEPPLNAIYRNAVLIGSKWMIGLFAVALVLIVIRLIRKIKRREGMAQLALLLVLACFPYVWYAVLANHSSIHCWFTYRVQLITVFAVLYAATSPPSKPKPAQP